MMDDGDTFVIIYTICDTKKLIVSYTKFIVEYSSRPLFLQDFPIFYFSLSCISF